DLDDEVRIVLLRRQLDARRDRHLAAKRDRHLPQLIVEEHRSLGKDLAIREHSGAQRHGRRQGQKRDEQPGADRGHHFGTKYPTPRNVRIASLPSFRRRPWTYTSTALLSTSAPHPYRRSSSWARESTAPGRCRSASSTAYSCAER